MVNELTRSQSSWQPSGAPDVTVLTTCPSMPHQPTPPPPARSAATRGGILIQLRQQLRHIAPVALYLGDSIVIFHFNRVPTQPKKRNPPTFPRPIREIVPNYLGSEKYTSISLRLQLPHTDSFPLSFTCNCNWQTYCTCNPFSFLFLFWLCFYSKTGFWPSYCQISTDLDKILHTSIVVRNTLVGRLRLRSARGRLQAKRKRLFFSVILVTHPKFYIETTDRRDFWNYRC